MTLEQLWTMTKSEFDKLNKRVDVLEDKVKVIDEKFDKKFDEINSKLNIMSNINILNHFCYFINNIIFYN